MKKFIVRIFTPNKILPVKGKLVRTPTEIIATRPELEQLKVSIRSQGITKYRIDQYTEVVKSQPEKVVDEIEDVIDDSEPEISDKVEIEELDPHSTLDSFLKEE